MSSTFGLRDQSAQRVSRFFRSKRLAARDTRCRYATASRLLGWESQAPAKTTHLTSDREIA